jgi:hypothetical protein
VGNGAAKNGLSKKERAAGQMQRAASARKTARSDYEEQQILLQLQAVERMKEMVQVPPAPAPHTRSAKAGATIPPQLQHAALSE